MSIYDRVDRFKSEFEMGAKHYMNAARIYAQSVNELGQVAIDAYEAEFPNVTRATWRILHKIGDGKLTLAALFICNPEVVKCVEKLPMKEQVKLVGDGVKKAETVPVYTFDKVVAKPVASMTAMEIHRLIDVDAGKVRDMKEQQVKAKRDEEFMEKRRNDRYEIKGGWLFVRTVTEFSKKELLDIVERMA